MRIPATNCVAMSALLFLVVCAPVLADSGLRQHFIRKTENDEWKAPPKAIQRVNPIPKSPESIANGGALFSRHCAMCHGKEGRGDGPSAKNMVPKPTNLAMMGKTLSEGAMAWKIETGEKPMPSWKKMLSERQIWDIVNYIRRLKW
jgi:mono/diheme cytochrome c family protein